MMSELGSVSKDQEKGRVGMRGRRGREQHLEGLLMIHPMICWDYSGGMWRRNEESKSLEDGKQFRNFFFRKWKKMRISTKSKNQHGYFWSNSENCHRIIRCSFLREKWQRLNKGHSLLSQCLASHTQYTSGNSLPGVTSSRLHFCGSPASNQPTSDIYNGILQIMPKK